MQSNEIDQNSEVTKTTENGLRAPDEPLPEPTDNPPADGPVEEAPLIPRPRVYGETGK